MPQPYDQNLEQDQLSNAIGRYSKSCAKLRARELRYEGKPEKYSFLTRVLRLGATLGTYTGIVVLKNSLFPLNGTPSLGFQVFGLGQISVLLAGVRLMYADNYRKGKINKLKWKKSTRQNDLSREISKSGADRFFKALIEQASNDFTKIFSSRKLSRRDKALIKKSFTGIKDAVTYFASGYYTGSVDLNQLDLLKKRINDLEEACYQVGIDVEDSKKEINDGIKKVRRDEIGEDIDFIDTDGFEREDTFPSRHPAITNGEGIKPTLRRTRRVEIEPPSRGLSD